MSETCCIFAKEYFAQRYRSTERW